MQTRPTTLESPARRASTRHWRSLLAGLISLALVLSLFHCLCFDCDDAVPTASIAQPAGDDTGKPPAQPAPLHCDHCLTHVSIVTAQETSVAIEYTPHAYRLSGMPARDTAEPASPFKPPRV